MSNYSLIIFLLLEFQQRVAWQLKWIWEFHNIWETKPTGRLVPNTDMFLCKLSPGPVLKDRLLQTDASSLRLREIGFFGVMVEIEGGRRTHLRRECATLAYRDRFPTLPLQRLYLYVHTYTNATLHLAPGSGRKPRIWKDRCAGQRIINFRGSSCCCAYDVRERRNCSSWISGGAFVEY